MIEDTHWTFPAAWPVQSQFSSVIIKQVSEEEIVSLPYYIYHNNLVK